jgi:hypothetical protein
VAWFGVTNASFTVPSRIWNEFLALFELLFLLLFFLTQLIALGMLFAIALNLAITLLVGLTQNAFCFAPFFVPLR